MAIVAPLFFLVFFACIQAGLWSVETSAIVASQEDALRLASAAASNPSSTTAPSASTVLAAISPELRPALFGTRVVACNAPCLGVTCATLTPQEVFTAYGPDVIAICVDTLPGYYPGGLQPDPGLVHVDFVGYASAIVPPDFSLGWKTGMIPFDIGGVSHSQRFAR